MVRTWRFHCRGVGSIPGRGTKIPQVAWHGQKKKKDIKGHVTHQKGREKIFHR